MTRAHAILALALLCCAVFHLHLAWDFRDPRWSRQRVWALAIWFAEVLAAALLAYDAASGR